MSEVSLYYRLLVIIIKLQHFFSKFSVFLYYDQLTITVHCYFSQSDMDLRELMQVHTFIRPFIQYTPPTAELTQCFLWVSVCSCYYTSRVCKSYFIDDECYENFTSAYNSSACIGGYFLKGRCYYRTPQTCGADQYLQQCTCFPQRSSTFTYSTCQNIGAFYSEDYCYYTRFDCSGYSVNGQCYRRVNAKFIRRVLVLQYNIEK